MLQNGTLKNFFASEIIQASSWGFFLNLLLAGFLAYLLGKIYIRYGMALSNRKVFSKNFVLLSLTTTLVITIVQSSLALSLGLIGALSIVRFRAAIKEPEELTYLFFAIAIGLGLGANQRLKTIIAFTIVSILIWLISRVSQKVSDQQGYLTVTSKKPDQWGIPQITEILEENCEGFHLRRFDKTETIMESLFLVSIQKTEALEELDRHLRKKDSTIQIIFSNTSEDLQ